MNANGKTYYGLNGRKYTMGAKLGSGGEGIVYSILDDPLQVAKVFNKVISGREDKLKAIINLKIPSRINGIVRLALPEDILYENSSMVGFVMPYVDDTLRLFKVCRENDEDKDAVFPNYGWKHSVVIAYNFAEMIEYLHSKGVIVGDFNPNNFVVDGVNGGMTVFVDCDSFDIRDPKTGRRYPCEVAFLEVAAPELQNVTSFRGRHTIESDNFSLAMHIFRLLMNNSDPYNAVDIGIHKQSISGVGAGNNAIIKGECPYVRHLLNKQIPDSSLPYEFLPLDIRKLFNRVFYYNEVTAVSKQVVQNRPTASEWAKVLRKYAIDNRFVTICAENPRHIYPNNNSQCPWCKLERNQKQRTKNKSIYASNVQFKDNDNKFNVTKKGNATKKSIHNTVAAQKNIQHSGTNQYHRNNKGLYSVFGIFVVGMAIIFLIARKNLFFRDGAVDVDGYSDFISNNEIATPEILESNTPTPITTTTSTPPPSLTQTITQNQQEFIGQDTEINTVIGVVDPSTNQDIFIPEATISSFLWPDADTKVYAESDLEGMTQGQVRYLINEIYAREGYTFKNELWKKYFEQKTWYRATVPCAEFTANPNAYLNTYEAQNVDMINHYQEIHDFEKYT